MCLKSNKPEDHGIFSKAILDFIEEAEAAEDINLTNFMLLCEDSIVAKFCKKPYEENCPKLLFSVTKSFTSLGVGIAIDKGYFKLDDKVISFFHDKRPAIINDNLRKMTIKHLLTMTTGIHDNTYEMLYSQKDWVRGFLAQDFPHEPGTYYRYSTHASYLLGVIIERTTGESVLEFLNKYLFKPLYIPKPQWESCPIGIVSGGMGLSLTPESLAKIGILLLNKGYYFGKRIISEEYIISATSSQVIKDSDIDKENKKIYSGSQYGYQFHIGLNGCFRADGAFGQLCFISPKDKIIVVAASRDSKMEKLLNLIHTHLLGNKESNELVNNSFYNKLQEKLSSMEYDVPKFKEIPSGVPELNDKIYSIEKNSNGIEQIIFSENGEELNCKIIYCDKRYNNLRFSFVHPIYDKSIFIKDIENHEQRYISYASWENGTILNFTVIYIETPYVVNYRFTFKENSIKIEFKINVSFTLRNFTAWGKIK